MARQPVGHEIYEKPLFYWRFVTGLKRPEGRSNREKRGLESIVRRSGILASSVARPKPL